LFLRVAEFEHCSSSDRDTLCESANWLIQNFSWIEIDANSASFIQTQGISDRLFEIAMISSGSSCLGAYQSSKKVLLRVSVKLFYHDESLGSLEKGLKGLLGLCLTDGTNIDVFLNTVKDEILSNDYSAEVLQRTADRIQHDVDTFRQFRGDVLDAVLKHVDTDQLNTYLRQTITMLRDAAQNIVGHEE